jgi:hypothetical protein
MERYKKKFSGLLAALIKSDDGDWVRYEECKALMKVNEDALFDVIKERNEEIQLHKTCIDELNELISKVNRWREDDLKEHQKDSMQNFVDIQRLGDDLQELNLWNSKLMLLLILSTAFNFGAIIFFVCERMGLI